MNDGGKTLPEHNWKIVDSSFIQVIYRPELVS